MNFKQPMDLLFDLIKKENPNLPKDIIPKEWAVIEGPIQLDDNGYTRITLKCIVPSHIANYENKLTVNYHKLDIDKLVLNQTVDLTLNSPALMLKKMNLQVEDIDIDTSSNPFKIKNSNLLYYGSITNVELKTPLDIKTEIIKSKYAKIPTTQANFAHSQIFLVPFSIWGTLQGGIWGTPWGNYVTQDSHLSKIAAHCFPTLADYQKNKELGVDVLIAAASIGSYTSYVSLNRNGVLSNKYGIFDGRYIYKFIYWDDTMQDYVYINPFGKNTTPIIFTP